MDWLTTTRALFLLLTTILLSISVVRIWRSKFGRANHANGVQFHANIGFTRLDGFKSVALLLENESNAPVWTEEIEIALADLNANQQTSEPSCHEILKIRQTVSPTDLLPISLVETIYNAAGRPQRHYSCVLSSLVRYRVGEKWIEEQLPAYRVKMVGLTVAGVRHEKMVTNDLRHRGTLQDLTPTSANSK